VLPGAITAPLKPVCIRTGLEPTSVTIHGSPISMASINAMERPSEKDGNTKISEALR